MLDHRRAILTAGCLALRTMEFVRGLSAADAAPPPLPNFMPYRAPMLARACATPRDSDLTERLTSFCAGYLRAVLENDPRLSECGPFVGEVMEEIIARQRSAPLTDNNVLARDFVVEVAHDLCRRARR